MEIKGAIEPQANIYFDGKVTSRTVYSEDGRLTLGFMCQGDYEFNTEAKERMEIMAGQLAVFIEDDWQTYTAGQTFEIPANSRFQVKANPYADYKCYYLKEELDN